MAYYRYQTEGKTTASLKEGQYVLEGELELAPNVLYNINNIYNLKGLGVFSGKYRMKKITKKIAVGEGMTVSAEVTKV